ncbi:MAG: type II toxin-antitoxin system prevent-host-death family antitoxin [Acidobacteriota bacterium]
MLEIDLQKAEARLSQLLERVAGGEEILITREGEPVARLIPPTPRLLGRDVGLYEVPEDFNAPMPEEELQRFEV